ncbi:MAG: hypothetical protein JWO07_854 [Candidatus Saccharibacteria bacterium]|nr:hypothetical protein [Candidatus Saccharibacteria bacterium]
MANTIELYTPVWVRLTETGEQHLLAHYIRKKGSRDEGAAALRVHNVGEGWRRFKFEELLIIFGGEVENRAIMFNGLIYLIDPT